MAQPFCGPPLILSPTLKHWGTPRRQGLCSHPAHLWATSDFVPRSETLGTPQAVRVMWPPGPLWAWATSDFVPCSKAWGTPKAAGFM